MIFNFLFFSFQLLIFNCQLSIFNLLHMHIPLWEWDLDIILVESIVDALENLAVITIACVNAYPDDNLEDEGRVAQFLEDDADTSLLVDAVEF